MSEHLLRVFTVVGAGDACGVRQHPSWAGRSVVGGPPRAVSTAGESPRASAQQSLTGDGGERAGTCPDGLRHTGDGDCVQSAAGPTHCRVSCSWGRGCSGVRVGDN